ncbi:Hypothetical predicted protein [Mytilus galloprovincialis]|uniref:TNFR-Cys domain-containing protein n=1 Tax=Mytilus galloprovincialis TaxID=29158 RepID=A0A8B6EGF7_MYTGA|nr:Hypothetical predicted protein [Mytilus galloprovincialis]
MQIMRTLRFLVIALLLIGFCETTKQYIVRKIGNATRRCIPISYCKPGHEILPCKVEYTNDICTSCPPGLVQPDYIQSTVDQTITTCFENRNEDNCAAHDIEPSREYGAKACTFAKYCKCNTDECYFGDPCACSNSRECGINESLHKNGTCVKCSQGTMKNKTGCGPCYPIQVTVESIKATRRPLTSMKTQNGQDVTTGNKLPTLADRQSIVTLVPSNGITQSKGRTTQGREEKTVSTITGSSNKLIAVTIVLAFLVIVAIVLIIVLRNQRRKKDQEINIEQGRPLVPPQNDMIVNDNVENRNREDNDIGGSLNNVEGQNNKNTNDSDSANNNSSRQNALSKDKRYQNQVKDNEIADELPKIITQILDKTSEISSSSFDYSSGHHVTQDAQLNDNTNIFNIHQAENLESQEHVELAQVETLDEGSIRQHSSDGYSLTEHSCNPVAQVSDERGDNSADEPSSGYYSDNVPDRSPMSDNKDQVSLQKYDELVSVSDRNTEGTESMTSCLEMVNFELTGQTTPSDHSEYIEPKQIIVKNDSGVFDSGNRQN